MSEPLGDRLMVYMPTTYVSLLDQGISPRAAILCMLYLRCRALSDVFEVTVRTDPQSEAVIFGWRAIVHRALVGDTKVSDEQAMFDVELSSSMANDVLWNCLRTLLESAWASLIRMNPEHPLSTVGDHPTPEARHRH